MLELGSFMALLGLAWFSVSLALGTWRDGILFDVPLTSLFINLGVWVGGVPVLGVGFWLAAIGAVAQLVRILPL